MAGGGGGLRIPLDGGLGLRRDGGADVVAGVGVVDLAFEEVDAETSGAYVELVAMVASRVDDVVALGSDMDGTGSLESAFSLEEGLVISTPFSSMGGNGCSDEGAMTSCWSLIASYSPGRMGTTRDQLVQRVVANDRDCGLASLFLPRSITRSGNGYEYLVGVHTMTLTYPSVLRGQKFTVVYTERDSVSVSSLCLPPP